MKEYFEAETKRIESWLDDLIKNMEKLTSLERFDDDIETCMLADRSIQIYKGFDTLAFYLKKLVTYNPNWYPESNKGRMSFEYKGYEVFELYSVNKGEE